MGGKIALYCRVVVAYLRVPRDGLFIEHISFYVPTIEPKLVNIDVDKANKFIANGAQPTDTVRALLKDAK